MERHRSTTEVGAPKVMGRFEQLRDLAARRGLRMTPQRQALLRVLGGRVHHPTADELYRRVRRILPSVSPATVYRNVQTLARAGVIAPLERAGGAVRYDPNLDEHHHFVCGSCGQVLDIYLTKVGYAVDRRKSRLAGAQIRSCGLQLHGICGDCRSSR